MREAAKTSLFLLQAIINRLTGRTYRELLRVTARYPFLATECSYGFAGDRRFNDLFLLYIVRKALVVALIERLANLFLASGDDIEETHGLIILTDSRTIV